MYSNNSEKLKLPSSGSVVYHGRLLSQSRTDYRFETGCGLVAKNKGNCGACLQQWQRRLHDVNHSLLSSLQQQQQLTRLLTGVDEVAISKAGMINVMNYTGKQRR